MKNNKTPTKLTDTYSSFLRTKGISLTNISRMIPPPTAVITPANIIMTRLRPNILKAMLAPSRLNIPRPNASKVKNSLIRFFT